MRFDKEFSKFDNYAQLRCKCQYNFAGFGLNNNVGKPAFLFSPFCLLKVSDPSSGMTDR